MLKKRLTKLGWFVAYWLMSVTAMLAVAMLIRAVLHK